MRARRSVLLSVLWSIPLGLLSACGDDAEGPGDDSGPGVDASRITDRGFEPVDADESDSSPSADAEPSDAGEAPGVVVVNEGGTALYHGPDGTLRAIRATPSEFPLPGGGHVTLILDRIYTFVDVPNESRIHVRAALPTSLEALQSLQIDVPASPDGKPISIWSGCHSASGPGQHILTMASNCLAADDTAELWIVAYDGGSGHHIHVDDIPVGNAAAPPRVVTLGAWVPFPAEPPLVVLSELPAGTTASLTTYSLRGELPIYNLTSSFVMSSSTAGISYLATLSPELGLEWRRHFVVEIPTADEYQDWTRRGSVRSLGHPLAQSSSVSAAGLLPAPSSLVLDAESGFVSFGFDAPLPSSVDRVRVSFHEDGSERSWEIWLPPHRTELQLPMIPAEFLTMLPNPDRAELRAEDRAGIDGWAAVLDGWVGEIDFRSSAWDWPGLGDYSNRWFVP